MVTQAISTPSLSLQTRQVPLLHNPECKGTYFLYGTEQFMAFEPFCY